MENPTVNINVTSVSGESRFDGGLLQLVGWTLLELLITVCTLGICLPWAYCMVYRWEAKHTVINGHRLAFDGTAMQLFGKWLLWLLLTIVTVGIYSFWVNIKLKKWKVQHTRFADKSCFIKSGRESLVGFSLPSIGLCDYFSSAFLDSCIFSNRRLFFFTSSIS